MTAAGKFYSVRSGAAKFGPFIKFGSVGLAHNSSAIPFHNTRQRNGMIFDVGLGRAAKFPGVLFVERPAHCRIVFPLPGAITDHSTLHFVDPDPGNAAAYVFEFKKAGPITPGNVEVDISAAVTAADVAAAFDAALVTYNGTAPVLTPSGFIGKTEAGSDTGFFLQAFCEKNAHSTAFERGTKGSWFFKTWGSWANTAPVPSIPGEWTGRIIGFSGGKNRRAGVTSIPEDGGRPWVGTPGGQFVPPLVPPIE